MSGDPVPQRTDTAPQAIATRAPRAPRTGRVLAAAMLALAFATAAMPARAASVLSDGSVSPTSGSTATVFTFTVRYTSADTPARPAHAVWAQVGTASVTLTKVSGTAQEGVWQGTATLPAGIWQVTFHATTAGDPRPEPLLGPMITVTAPPPTPTPTLRPPPPPPPTATPAPVLTQLPAPPPTTAARHPAPQPTPPQTDDATASASASPSPTASAPSSPEAMTPSGVSSPTADASEDPAETPAPTATGAEAADPPRSILVPSLIFGGSLSLAGAAVLARQWLLLRRERP